jgi:spectinomycin phosphotransferase/16S rRNA (guanine(1405)-N(7))-methyltransferase
MHVERIEYAPVGFGSYHWWVEAEGRRWFVTVDDLEPKRRGPSESIAAPRRRLQAALTAARELCDAGLDFVIAAVPSGSGDVVATVGGRSALAVYPEVVGETSGFGSYPTSDGRLAVVDRLVELHQVAVDTTPSALADDHTIVKRAELLESLADLSKPWTAGPFGERARGLLTQHADAVIDVLDRFDRLAGAVRNRPDRLVLTHGEPHAGNTITTADGVVLIDWDTALVAPPERDLWSLIDEDAGVAEFYTERTGVALDSEALELYGLSWDLTEIALFVDDFRHPHAVDDDTRTAWEGLQRHLDPARWG